MQEPIDTAGANGGYAAGAVETKRLFWLRISCAVGLKRADAVSQKRHVYE